jgi:p24 family protein beta-1
MIHLPFILFAFGALGCYLLGFASSGNSYGITLDPNIKTCFFEYLNATDRLGINYEVYRDSSNIPKTVSFSVMRVFLFNSTFLIVF